jgi:hypothetical protein
MSTVKDVGRGISKPHESIWGLSDQAGVDTAAELALGSLGLDLLRYNVTCPYSTLIRVCFYTDGCPCLWILM